MGANLDKRTKDAGTNDYFVKYYFMVKYKLYFS